MLVAAEVGEAVAYVLDSGPIVCGPGSSFAVHPANAMHSDSAAIPETSRSFIGTPVNDLGMDRIGNRQVEPELSTGA